jgi:hypothetical protein
VLPQFVRQVFWELEQADGSPPPFTHALYWLLQLVLQVLWFALQFDSPLALF